MIDWIPEGIDVGKPRYIAIADAISKDIRKGRLALGDRLPPQRRLAGLLGIDFTTVSRAYAEAQSRGLIESHVGRGTFVAGATSRAAPDPVRAMSEDLAMNMPPEPTDPELVAKMQEALGYVSANLVGLLRYQSPIGTEHDREAASTWRSMRGNTACRSRASSPSPTCAARPAACGRATARCGC